MICCWLLRNGGWLLYPRQDPYSTPGTSVSTEPWEIQGGRDSPFLRGPLTGVGGTRYGLESRVQFLPEAPPTTHCLLFLEMGGHGLLSICSWGQQGTRGSGTDRHHLRGRACRASKNRWAAVLAGNLRDLVGWSPLSLPQTFLVFIHSNVRSWSTLFLDPEHSAAPHCQQDSDFSDCHFLCVPAVPHPGFSITSPLNAQRSTHAPTQLAWLPPSLR